MKASYNNLNLTSGVTFKWGIIIKIKLVKWFTGAIIMWGVTFTWGVINQLLRYTTCTSELRRVENKHTIIGVK